MGTKQTAEKTGLIARYACVVTMMLCCLATNASATTGRLHTFLDTRTHRSGIIELSDTLTEAQRDSIAEAALANAAEKKKNAEEVINGGETGDGVKTRKQKEAEAKANREAEKARQREAKAKIKAEQDAIDDSIKQARAAQKEQDKVNAALQKERDKQTADSVKAVAAAEKQARKEAEQREKARVDSIEKRKRDAWKNLTKEEKEELRQQNDARRQQYKHGREVAARLDSASDRLRKELRDSLYHEAWRVEMSRSKLNKWTKYFSRIYGQNKDEVMRQICDSIDTVRHDTKAAQYTKAEVDDKTRRVYGKILMTELFNRKNERKNFNMVRALDTYMHLYDDIKFENEQARYYDSIQIEKNRKPGQQTYKLLNKRTEQREKRIWKEIDHYMRSYELAPYDGTVSSGRYGTVVDVKKMFADDSCYNKFRDQLSVPLWKRFSLRTNGLAWLLAVPNLGVEFDLSGDPASQYSVLFNAYFKPNTLKQNTVKSRIDYSVWSVNLEGRKYWRNGGKQTVQHLLDWDINDYTLDTTRPDTLPRKEREKIYGFYYLVNDTTEGSEYKSSQIGLYRSVAPLNPYGDHDTTVVIRTASWLKRLWQPFRYNFISGRYQHKPRTKMLYYLGGMVGYERYRYVISSTGQQGRRVYACATGGVVLQNLARFGNGSAIDVEMGLALGVQGTTYHNFGYNTEFSCYEFKNRHRRVITPYPVVKDVHVSLVYSFRPFENKVHNLFLTEKFRKQMDEVRYKNEAAAEKVVDHFTKKSHIKRRNRFDTQVEKADYGKRKEDRKNKKEDRKRRREEIKEYGMTKAEYDKRMAEENPEEAKRLQEEKAAEIPEKREFSQPKHGRIVVFDPKDL